MVTDSLVEEQIEDGRRLAAHLRRTQFDVTAAFWVKTREEGRWFLYLASKALDEMGAAPAYRVVYGALDAIRPARLSMWEIKLISPANPIAQDVLAERDRHPGKPTTHYQGATVGHLSIEDAYIYPPGSSVMTDRELLQTLIAMANPSAGSDVQSATITLRDGSAREVLISGFQLQMPGGLTVNVLDPNNHTASQISGADIASIQQSG